VLAGFPVQLRIIIGALHRELEPAADPPAMPQAGVAPPAARAPDPDHRPGWIGAERWDGLPAMLRAALIGSAAIDGEIRAASPHMDRVLRTRYVREVSELIDAVCGGPAQLGS
jgi:hypothetical protein